MQSPSSLFYCRPDRLDYCTNGVVGGGLGTGTSIGGLLPPSRFTSHLINCTSGDTHPLFGDSMKLSFAGDKGSYFLASSYLFNKCTSCYLFFVCFLFLQIRIVRRLTYFGRVSNESILLLYLFIHSFILYSLIFINHTLI